MNQALNLKDLAIETAKEAGEFCLQELDSDYSIETKSTQTDNVTAIDKASEKLIIKKILDLRPDDGIQSEEESSRESKTGIIWHIDPIDGTTNFIYKLPFTISIAAADLEHNLIASAVYEPINDRMYSASKDSGSFLNGSPISCDKKDSLSQTLLATGFSYEPERRKEQADLLTKILPKIRDIRRIGSAALDLCLVAAGNVNAYYEKYTNTYDIAAGSLIAAEAGAQVTPFSESGKDRPILAANPNLYSKLEKLIAD